MLEQESGSSVLGQRIQAPPRGYPDLAKRPAGIYLEPRAIICDAVTEMNGMTVLVRTLIPGWQPTKLQDILL